MRVLAATLLVLTLATPALAQEKTDRANPAVKAVIEDVADGNRILYAKKILDGLGHVSGRNPADPNRFFLSRSLAPGLVTPDDIVEYDLDAKPIGDDRRGYVERYIHAEIYRARPDVKGVVHSHSPTVIPFGISDVKLRAFSQGSAILADGAPVFDAMLHEAKLGFLINTPALGKALAQSLGQHWVVLMRGHGDAVAGTSVRQAVAYAIGAEESAQQLARAIGLGGKVQYMTAGEVENQLAMSRSGAADGADRTWQLWKSEIGSR